MKAFEIICNVGTFINDFVVIMLVCLEIKTMQTTEEVCTTALQTLDLYRRSDGRSIVMELVWIKTSTDPLNLEKTHALQT